MKSVSQLVKHRLVLVGLRRYDYRCEHSHTYIVVYSHLKHSIHTYWEERVNILPIVD